VQYNIHIFHNNHQIINSLNQLTYLQLFWKDILVQWALQFAFWWLLDWAKNAPWAAPLPANSTFRNSTLHLHRIHTHVSTDNYFNRFYLSSLKVCKNPTQTAEVEYFADRHMLWWKSHNVRVKVVKATKCCTVRKWQCNSTRCRNMIRNCDKTLQIQIGLLWQDTHSVYKFS